MRGFTEVFKTVFLQLMRDRVFHLIFVFLFFLLCLNFLFAELAIADQRRIYVNFGLSLIHFLSIALAVSLSVLSFRREIHNRSIYTILVRPVSRERYYLGQALGVVAVVGGLVLIASVLLHALFLSGESASFFALFYLAVFGIAAEVFLAVAFTQWLTNVLSYPIAVAGSFSLLALGHWMSSFRFYLDGAEPSMIKNFGEGLFWLIPHLERVNFRYWPLNPEIVDWAGAGWGLLQIFSYCALFLSLGCLAFRGRDLV